MTTVVPSTDDDSDSMTFLLMSSMNLTKSRRTTTTTTTPSNVDNGKHVTTKHRTKSSKSSNPPNAYTSSSSAKPLKVNEIGSNSINTSNNSGRRKKSTLKKNVNVQSIIDNQELGGGGGGNNNTTTNTITNHTLESFTKNDTTSGGGGGGGGNGNTTKKKPTTKQKVKKPSTSPDAILTSIYTPTLAEYQLNITDTICVESHWQIDCRKPHSVQQPQHHTNNNSDNIRLHTPSELFTVDLLNTYRRDASTNHVNKLVDRVGPVSDDDDDNHNRHGHNTLIIRWQKLSIPPTSGYKHPDLSTYHPLYIHISRKSGKLVQPFHIVIYYRQIAIISLYIHQDSPYSRLTSIVNVGRSSRKKDTVSFEIPCIESNATVVVGAQRYFDSLSGASSSDDEQFVIEYVYIQYNINELSRSLWRLSTFSQSFTRSTPPFTTLPSPQTT